MEVEWHTVTECARWDAERDMAYGEVGDAICECYQMIVCMVVVGTVFLYGGVKSCIYKELISLKNKIKKVTSFFH